MHVINFVLYKLYPPILSGDCAHHTHCFISITHFITYIAIAIFKNLLNVHVLLDYDSSKIKLALGSGMLQQINNFYL